MGAGVGAEAGDDEKQKLMTSRPPESVGIVFEVSDEESHRVAREQLNAVYPVDVLLIWLDQLFAWTTDNARLQCKQQAQELDD
mgnify:CR=1 FL=1